VHTPSFSSFHVSIAAGLASAGFSLAVTTYALSPVHAHFGMANTSSDDGLSYFAATVVFFAGFLIAGVIGLWGRPRPQTSGARMGAILNVLGFVFALAIGTVFGAQPAYQGLSTLHAAVLRADFVHATSWQLDGAPTPDCTAVIAAIQNARPRIRTPFGYELLAVALHTPTSRDPSAPSACAESESGQALLHEIATDYARVQSPWERSSHDPSHLRLHPNG
jgi:hypothetical protein